MISRRPTNDSPFYAIRKATHIVLTQRPQLSLLTHRHICANKHNTLRKIAKSVNDLNVGLLFILPCSSVYGRKLFAHDETRAVLWMKAFRNRYLVSIPSHSLCILKPS